MPDLHARSLAWLARARQRLLSEQLGDVLPRAQQQTRAFHIGLSDERSLAAAGAASAATPLRRARMVSVAAMKRA